MPLETRKKYIAYYNILNKLNNGEYLTLARKGYLSEPGSRLWFKKMEEDGYIVGYKNKENKKFAKLTNKGLNLLEQISPININNYINNIKGSDRNGNDNE